MSEHQKEVLDRVVKALDTVPEECRAVAGGSGQDVAVMSA